MAYAAAQFAFSVLEALGGMEKVECAYVRSDCTEAKYFATPIKLGKNGIESNLGMGTLIESEIALLEKALPELKASIQKGEDFVLKASK